MATGIRNISPESTAAVLDQIPFFTDGPDEYVTVSDEALGALKNYIRGEFDAESAQEALETITAREELADVAAQGMDDADVDLSELIGFRRLKGAVQRVTPVRITATEEGDGVILILGSLRVPGLQKAKELAFGGLSCNIAEDYNVETKKTQQKGDLHFHTLDLTDGKSIFRVSLYVTQGLEPAAVKLALKAGEPLEEILSGPGSGGGGAVNLRDILSEEMVPWRAEITEVRQFESESEYALDGKSYSATLADGQNVWMRGDAEKKLHENFEKIKADLAAGKAWQVKVVSYQRDGDKVRMRTGLESLSAASYFAGLLEGATATAELPAAKEVVVTEEAEEAPAPKAVSKSNPFAKKKAAA
jgi:hypothetical protein